MDLITYLAQPGVTQKGLASAINEDSRKHGGKTVTQGAIHQWKADEVARLEGVSDKFGVPHKRVVQLVRVSHQKMTHHKLRPDLYDAEWAAA